MKVYVASSWRNEQQPAIVKALRSAGHEVYDFRNPTEGNHGFSWKQCQPTPPPWSAEQTREVLRHPIAEEGFGFDFNAMKWADACVMVQPSGRSAALELGWCAVSQRARKRRREGVRNRGKQMKLLRIVASFALTRLALLPRMPGFALLFVASLIEETEVENG